MSEKRTYDSFALTTIMPAPGWHAVYWLEEGSHLVEPLAALALGRRITRECAPSYKLVPSYASSVEEDWEIVGLTYDPGDHWTVCDAIGNYCGLLPPGWTLERFAEVSLCRYHHAAAPRNLVVEHHV
jgi:hypothetical protein